MVNGSAGGIVTAKILRKIALDKYYLNPKICKHCLNIIQVKENEKVSIIKRKEFCSRSCSAKFYNKFRKKEKPEKKKRTLIVSDTLTKKELKEKRSTWQSWRTAIRKHASQKMTSIEYRCSKCGYTKHNEICHKKPVSKFDDSCTLGEINNISNLIYLCPNHHWEFDNIAAG